MKIPDLISGAFWLGLGLLLSIWSIRYKIGGLTQPEAGFFPFVLGLLLIFLALILLLEQAKKTSLAIQKGGFSFLYSGWKRVAFPIFTLIFATFIFEKIGYLLTVFLLIILLMRGTGPQKWGTILITAFLSVTSVYLVFVLLLKQLYPYGLLGF